MGRIYFEVDPFNDANKIITDIDKAPRNARGRVEFSADFYLIKPKEIGRGNGTVLYRGLESRRQGHARLLQPRRRSLDPATDAHMGDGFLMKQGFTLLWVGWQFDPPMRDGLVHVYPPIATNNGSPLVGIVRSEVIVAKPRSTRRSPIATTPRIPWPTRTTRPTP